MRKAILGAVLASATLAGCVGSDEGRPNYASWNRYDYDRPDPAYNGYDADRYYRDDARYHERRLTERDRIYAGRDGRYYCRRSDGTTGLIVGGIAGGVLGDALSPGRSEVLGTLLGAAAGAAVGASIDRDHVTCR